MEACPLKKRDINSLDFVVNRLCMKLLTTDINIVRTWAIASEKDDDLMIAFY